MLAGRVAVQAAKLIEERDKLLKNLHEFQEFWGVGGGRETDRLIVTLTAEGYPSHRSPMTRSVRIAMTREVADALTVDISDQIGELQGRIETLGISVEEDGS